MATESKNARMDNKARAFLARQFAGIPKLLEEMTDLWATYLELGFPFVFAATRPSAESSDRFAGRGPCDQMPYEY
jgi:hypothetical protein